MITLVSLTKNYFYFDVSGTIVTVSRVAHNSLFKAQQRAISKFRAMS